MSEDLTLTPNVPARPSESDEYMVKAVADLLYKHLEGWLNGAGYIETEAEKRGVLDEIQDVLSEYGNLNADGYDLAKEFERKGWIPDALLVDELGALPGIVYRLLGDLTKQWIEVYKIECPFKAGDAVRVLLKNHPWFGKYGEVIRIYKDRAECVVRTVNHKAQEGYILPYEYLER